MFGASAAAAFRFGRFGFALPWLVGHGSLDRQQREALERQSPRSPRVDIVAQLNRMAEGAAGRELAGLAAYTLLRTSQARGRDVARRNAKHERMLAAGRFEGEGEPLAKAAHGHDFAKAAYRQDFAKAAHAQDLATADRVDRRQIAARQLRARYW